MLLVGPSGHLFYHFYLCKHTTLIRAQVSGLQNGLSFRGKKPRCVPFANFRGVHSPTMAFVQLPVQVSSGTPLLVALREQRAQTFLKKKKKKKKMTLSSSTVTIKKQTKGPVRRIRHPLSLPPCSAQVVTPAVAGAEQLPREP